MREYLHSLHHKTKEEREKEAEDARELVLQLAREKRDR
jgi:hypothetical protein